MHLGPLPVQGRLRVSSGWRDGLSTGRVTEMGRISTGRRTLREPYFRPLTRTDEAGTGRAGLAVATPEPGASAPHPMEERGSYGAERRSVCTWGSSRFKGAYASPSEMATAMVVTEGEPLVAEASARERTRAHASELYTEGLTTFIANRLSLVGVVRSCTAPLATLRHSACRRWASTVCDLFAQMIVSRG